MKKNPLLLKCIQLIIIKLIKMVVQFIFEELGKVDLVKMLKITTQERMLKTWYGNMKPCVNIVYLHVQEKLVI